ncbi:hypothetical protein KAH94_02255 [bacterium]|nr:hypothetical protein [bacterium]
MKKRYFLVMGFAVVCLTLVQRNFGEQNKEKQTILKNKLWFQIRELDEYFRNLLNIDTIAFLSKAYENKNKWFEKLESNDKKFLNEIVKETPEKDFKDFVYQYKKIEKLPERYVDLSGIETATKLSILAVPAVWYKKGWRAAFGATMTWAISGLLVKGIRQFWDKKIEKAIDFVSLKQKYDDRYNKLVEIRYLYKIAKKIYELNKYPDYKIVFLESNGNEELWEKIEREKENISKLYNKKSNKSKKGEL